MLIDKTPHIDQLDPPSHKGIKIPHNSPDLKLNGSWTFGGFLPPPFAQRFAKILAQVVVREINKDQQEAVKAIHNFNKLPGDPDYKF